MSLDLHRAALVTLVRAVPDVGIVHDYQRYARAESDFQAFYLYQPADGVPHIRGWQLSNVGIEERRLGRGNRVLNKFRWVLRGYLSFNDALASELVFDSVCEDIRAAYRANPTLGGLATAEAYGEAPDGMQKTGAGPVLFCGVLCNSATLELETWSYAQ